MSKLARSKRSVERCDELRFTRADVIHAVLVAIVTFVAGMLAKTLGL